MSQKREFRKLNTLDLEVILQMANNFRNGFVLEDKAIQFFSNPMNWIYACIQEKQIIGFAYGYELNRLDNKGNMLYIHEIGVLPEYQRQGIGLQIINNIKIVYKELRLSKIFLFTQKHNNAACSLYEKAGGEKTNNSYDDDVTYFFK